MKNTILALLLISANSFSAQVTIGKGAGPSAVKTSVLLEFAAGQNKGIIVPYVRTLPVTPTEGTIVLDATTATKARMKYYNGNTTSGTNGYVDLSGQNGDISTVITTQPGTTTTEVTTSRTILGTIPSSLPSNFPQGVLVLNSTNKAMVLPIVADVQNILKPSPGMMVYVNKQGSKRLAVFNGSKWSFWQPN